MSSGPRPSDVAVIGLSCRFPDAANPTELWNLLGEEREAARPLDDISAFDADFFAVSPREARAMDPRQRLALELTWELLESAFIVPEALRGQQVGVYLGAMNDDYAYLTLRDGADNVDHHSFTGVSRAMIANRVSYAFGLCGPSMAIDSGQSSSLVAVHLACESLRCGEATLAIAGGVHLNSAPETGLLEDEFGARSASGHTYTFDSRADGYVRSEGGALVLLKSLRDALDCGDPIRAVIRGSAVGNAGHGPGGPTAPSVRGQVDVIRRALTSAGLAGPDSIDYVEAHGTGTPVGDAAEAQALGEVYGRSPRAPGVPVVIGSVKTNIGHTAAAAGVAGLAKVVLALDNGLIPPTVNHADPATDLAGLGLTVNTTGRPWPAGDRPRRAGVSSFGMGGTNAHVIVEEPPAPPAAAATATGPAVWVVTARSQRALANQAARLLRHLTSDADRPVGDVAWSLATARTHFEHRAVIVGSDRDTLMAGLASLAAGRPGPDVVTGRSLPGTQLDARFPELSAVGRQFADGATVDWAKLLGGGRRIPLPTYAFERQHFWLGDEAETPATTTPAGLADRLHRLEPDERRRRLVELVTSHVAAALGYPEGDAVDPGRAFADLGLDSLAIRDLRDSLSAETGLTVSRTDMVDCPNPQALAEHLGDRLLQRRGDDADDQTIRSVLAKVSPQQLRRAGLLDQLLVLAGESDGTAPHAGVSDDVIDSLGPDALIAMALNTGEYDDV
ncbi:MAG: beta-ketoacyl synthase N-terminal-like domain-containing protein [Mycobacterium sp.]